MHVFCPFRIQKGGFQAAWTSVEESTEQHRSVPYPSRKLVWNLLTFAFFSDFPLHCPVKICRKQHRKRRHKEQKTFIYSANTVFFFEAFCKMMRHFANICQQKRYKIAENVG